jgi:serine/threonine-protein kinase PknK
LPVALFELPQAVAFGLRSPRTIPRDNGIATLTAELDEDSAVRLLSASDSADDREQACRRAAELAVGIDGERRPLAALQAQLLLVQAEDGMGRRSRRTGAGAARCAELGLSRVLVDANLVAWRRQTSLPCNGSRDLVIPEVGGGALG